MTPADIHSFASRLMLEIWLPFDSSRLAEFYHHDVIGHHRAQTITFSDIENRLAWDRKNFRRPRYDIRQIIAEDNLFAIRFHYSALSAKAAHPEDCEIKTEVIYFYQLRNNKISEFWLLSSFDFDYNEKA